MQRQQKGFSVYIVLLLIVVLGVLGSTGWLAWRHSRKDTAIIPQSVETPAKKTVEPKTEEPTSVTWETYKNEEAKLTFKYPSTWESKVEGATYYNDGTFGGVSGAITSPQGHPLSWVYQIMGGKGGDCQPAANDIPFATGNKCSSKQIISAEKSRNVTAPVNTGFRNLFGDTLYITHTKYLASTSNAKPTYQICLDPYYTAKTNTHDDETPTAHTSMGLLFACEYWSTGFNAKFTVKDEADFTSNEAKMAEEIMRTFDSL